MFGKSDNLDCPLRRAPCTEHKCRWYIQVIGQHPNTGEQINRWDCAIAWLPALMIENSKEQRHTCASVDKFRDEMAQANGLAAIHERIANASAALAAPEQEPKLIASE